MSEIEDNFNLQPFLILSFYGIIFFVYKYFTEIKEYILENKSIELSFSETSSTEGVIVPETSQTSCSQTSSSENPQTSEELLSEIYPGSDSEVDSDYSSDESYVQPNTYTSKLRKRKRKSA